MHLIVMVLHLIITALHLVAMAMCLTVIGVKLSCHCFSLKRVRIYSNEPHLKLQLLQGVCSIFVACHNDLL